MIFASEAVSVSILHTPLAAACGCGRHGRASSTSGWSATQLPRHPDYFPIDAWDGPDEGIGPSFNHDRCPGTDFCVWGNDLLADDGPWRPGIHMPRWASRLTLTVTSVRVQRLQDISEEDAIAEGVDAVSMADAPRQTAWSRRQDFAQLWDSINGKHPCAAWSDNPWIVALTFSVTKQNIDALQMEAA